MRPRALRDLQVGVRRRAFERVVDQRQACVSPLLAPAFVCVDPEHARRRTVRPVSSFRSRSPWSATASRAAASTTAPEPDLPSLAVSGTNRPLITTNTLPLTGAASTVLPSAGAGTDHGRRRARLGRRPGGVGRDRLAPVLARRELTSTELVVAPATGAPSDRPLIREALRRPVEEAAQPDRTPSVSPAARQRLADRSRSPETCGEPVPTGARRSATEPRGRSGPCRGSAPARSRRGSRPEPCPRFQSVQ